MRMVLALVYTAFLMGANAAMAGEGAVALATGDMQKLVFAEPKALPDIDVLDGADRPRALSAHRGKWMVLNFWATWCAPCLREMPSLDRLAVAMPGIAVVPVATGRNSVVGIEKFFAEAGVVHLPVLRDPKSELARSMAIFGLPVTVIVNPEGQEVARLIGDAEWDSDAAKAVLTALVGGD